MTKIYVSMELMVGWCVHTHTQLCPVVQTIEGMVEGTRGSWWSVLPGNPDNSSISICSTWSVFNLPRKPGNACATALCPFLFRPLPPPPPLSHCHILESIPSPHCLTPPSSSYFLYSSRLIPSFFFSGRGSLKLFYYKLWLYPKFIMRLELV